MIRLEYLGKKSGFILSLPFLSQKYVVEGPNTTVDMTDQDATNMMAVNPRMFRIVGVSREGLTPPGNIGAEKPFAPPAAAATPPAANVPDGTGAPAAASAEEAQTPAQAAREMLNEDDGGPKDQLGGDGIEGPDPVPPVTPPPPASGDPAAPPAADSKPAVEPVTMGALMGFKEPQLRAYAKDLYGYEFGPDDKRMGMIKKIKELEQARQLAAG